MGIRKKLAIGYSIAAIVGFALIYLTLQLTVHAYLTNQEQQVAQNDMNRAIKALGYETAALAQRAAELASRGDTAQFLQRGNYDYIKYNLSDAMCKQQRLQMLLLFDGNGQVMYARDFSASSGAPIDFPADYLLHLPQNPAFIQAATSGKSVSGLMTLPQGPALVVFQPTPYLQQGKPGMIILGRSLGSGELQRLFDLSAVQTTIQPASTATKLVNLSDTAATSQNITTDTQPNTLVSAAVFQDIGGNGNWRMETKELRLTYARGMAAFHHMMLLLLGTMGLCGVVAYGLVEWHVLRRLRHVTRNVERVRDFSDIAGLTAIGGHDEVGKLEHQFGHLLQELVTTHDRRDFLNRYDPLTGVYSRNHLDEYLRQLENHPEGLFAVIVGDIDCLKLANEIGGDEYGDKLLKLFVETIRHVCPNSAQCFRVGGDDFVVLLQNIDEPSAQTIIRRIEEEVYNFQQEPAAIAINFTVSLDYTLDRPVPAIRAAIEEAREQLQQEKLLHSQQLSQRLLQCLHSASQARDYGGDGHTERVAGSLLAFARRLGLPPQHNAALQLLAEFHDSGKIGLPDPLVFKRGVLSDEERIIMQNHARIGYFIARFTLELARIADAILKHHEWWNGQGYPLQLAGEAIPQECRMLAIVDAFDAMTHDRPYRKALSQEEALLELQRCAGTQFEPRLVKIFITMIVTGA